MSTTAIGASHPATRSFGITSAPGAGSKDAPSLLPSSALGVGGAQDTMTQLLGALITLRDAQTQANKSQVNIAQAEQAVTRRKQDEAAQRAKEAAEAGGIFKWIEDDLGIIGAAGLVSFNYYAVAADLALHKLDVLDNLKVDALDAALAVASPTAAAASIVLRHTDLGPEQLKEIRTLLEQCGIPKGAPGISDEDIRPVAHEIVTANLIVAGAVTSVVSCGTASAFIIAAIAAGLSYGGAALAESDVLDGAFGKGSTRWIGIGAQVAGAVVGTCAGMGASSGMQLTKSGQAAENAERGVAIVKGLEAGISAGDKAVVTANEYRRANAEIDVESAKYKLTQIERFIDLVIDGLKEAKDTHQKSAELIQGAVAELNATEVLVAQGTRV